VCEREREKERDSVCVCVCVRARACVRERESERASERERERDLLTSQSGSLSAIYHHPLSSEYGKYTIVKARFWPWFQVKGF